VHLSSRPHGSGPPSYLFLEEIDILATFFRGNVIAATDLQRGLRFIARMGSLSTAVRTCESVARLRHGVIGRGEAFAAGLTEEAIARLVRCRQWRKLLPGAYLVGGAPLTWYSRLEATQSWLGPMCLFSHRSAGALLELDGVPSGFVEVAIPTAKKAPGVIVHRLAPKDLPRSRAAKGVPDYGRGADVVRSLRSLAQAARGARHGGCVTPPTDDARSSVERLLPGWWTRKKRIAIVSRGTVEP
jgi:hypothetical protein